MQEKIQCYQESILHWLGNSNYITNDEKFNQFINDDVPGPDENVYSPYEDNENNDNYYTVTDIEK